jgi:hypothetical protein
MAISGVGETIADTVPNAPGAFLRVAFLDPLMTKLFFNKFLEVGDVEWSDLGVRWTPSVGQKFVRS